MLPSPLGQLFTDSKVNQSHALLLPVVEDVLWLDVTVTDLLRMQVVKGLHHLVYYLLKLVLGRYAVEDKVGVRMVV